MTNSLHFLFVQENLYFSFTFESQFCWIQKSRLVDFWFINISSVSFHSSCLHNFWRESQCNFSLSSSIGKVFFFFFPSVFFQDFFFVFDLLQLDYYMLGVDFLVFIFFSVLWASQICFLALPTWPTEALNDTSPLMQAHAPDNSPQSHKQM